MRYFALLATVALGGASHATILRLTGIADDFFTAYVSTDDSATGTQFLEQVNIWQSGPVHGAVVLTPGVTNYLHIVARDQFGQPSMFMADATLSDAGFQFASGTQALLTNASDWSLSLTGFGVNDLVPTIVGQNGQNIWGTQLGISLQAQRLWSNQTTGLHYFSTVLNPVPEPGTLAALGFGLAALARRRRR